MRSRAVRGTAVTEPKRARVRHYADAREARTCRVGGTERLEACSAITRAFANPFLKQGVVEDPSSCGPFIFSIQTTGVLSTAY